MKLLTSLNVPRIGTPASPEAGFLRVYGKTDGKLYYKDEGGFETGPLIPTPSNVYSDANPYFKDTNDWALRRFREALNRVDQEAADVVFIGESMVEGVGATRDASRFQSQIQKALQNRYNPAGVIGGEGYIPGRHTGSTPIPRWTYGGGYAHYSGNSSGGGEVFGLGRRAIRLDNVGETAQIIIAADRFIIFYTGGVDAGAFSISIDGTVTATIDGYNPADPGAFPGLRWDSGPLTPATHTVVITQLDSTASAQPTTTKTLTAVEGIMVYNGDGPDVTATPGSGMGVRTWDGGRGGYKSTDFYDPNATNTNDDYWFQPLSFIMPDLVAIELGGNEFLQQQDPTVFEASLNGLIDRVRGASNGSDPSILLVGIHEITSFTFPNGTGIPDIPWQSYLDVLKRVALSKGCAFIDMHDRIEPAGITAGSDLYKENIHANDYGHRLYGEEYVYALTGSRLPSGGFARQDGTANFQPIINPANTAFRFGYAGSAMSYNGGTLLFDNSTTLDGGTTYKAIYTGTASAWGTQAGAFVFYTTNSFTAGGIQTFTKRLNITGTIADFIGLEIKTTSFIRGNSFNSFTGGKTSLQMNADTGGVVTQTNAAANKGMIFRGFTGQSANLVEVQNDLGVVTASFGPSGNFAALSSAFVSGVSGTGGSGWRAAFRVLGTTDDVEQIIRTTASQTADAFQVQDSTGAVVSRIKVDGWFGMSGLEDVGRTGSYLYTNNSLATNGAIMIGTRIAGNKGLVIKASPAQVANNFEIQGSTGNVLMWMTASGSVYGNVFATTSFNTAYGQTYLGIQSASTTAVTSMFRSFAGQTSDLTQWQDPTGTRMSWVASDGGIFDQGNRVYSASNPPPASGGGTGDVTLAGAQTFTGLKTFGSSLLVTRGAETLAPVITGNATPVKVTVAPTATPPASPAVNDIWIVSDATGTAATPGVATATPNEIDYAERAITYDITTGTTYGDVEGLMITVPPQTDPYYLEFGGTVSFNNGTAAAGTSLMAYFIIQDADSGLNYAYNAATGYSLNGVNVNQQQSITANRRMQPHTTTRRYKVQARTSTALPAGWTAAQLLAGDVPNQSFWPPAYLKAVRA